MGRLQFFGPDAERFLDTVITRRVADMRSGQIRYGLMCNAAGGILDDVLVYRLPVAHSRSSDLPTFQVVVNASNRTKIVEWLERRLRDFEGKMLDATTATAMIAIQGPLAVGLVAPLFSGDLKAIRYYTGTSGEIDGHDCFVSRTGYTGEDGCEIICAADAAPDLWQTFINLCEPKGGMAAGLGARDTLRLEAAMPLYGHELSETINPIQAGLAFAVTFGDREFIGRETLELAARDAQQPVRVGLQLDGKRVPRQEAAVILGDEPIGRITSGTFSPTFERPIAMAYVQPSAQSVGTRLAVDIRGIQYPAVVVPLPFYERGRQN
jgi:aminomethyltransferase